MSIGAARGILRWADEGDDLAGCEILEPLLVLQAAGEEQGVGSGRPFVMEAGEEDGLLGVAGTVVGAGLGKVGVLEQIAAFELLVLREEQDGILGGELGLGAGVPFDAGEVLVGTEAGLGVVIEVEGVAEAGGVADLGGELMPFTGAEVFGGGVEAEAVPCEQPGVFVLGQVLGQRGGVGGGEEAREEVFVEPHRFVAEVEPRGVAQGVVAGGEVEVRGVRGVVGHHRAGGFAAADVGHVREFVEVGEVGGPDGGVLIEEEAGEVDGALVF